jgi:hypothetical protein
MQLGNFAPDLFGPVAEYAFTNLGTSETRALKSYLSDNAQARGAAVFLHFDSLSNDLAGNADFDFLFQRLLESTRRLLASYNSMPGDDRVRKTLTLVTLGASLHAVQDFYSHSDWVHKDFADRPADGNRAPTWFEFRDRHPDPGAWPFQLQSGIYPPVAGVHNTHTHMNHDNSRLMCREVETPGQPYRSEAEFHAAGAVPAHGDDASDEAHQQFAVETAVAASIEWVARLQQDPEAAKAIAFARAWNLSKQDSRLAKELDAGELTERALACAAGKWDGDDPPGSRGAICRSALERRMTSASGGAGLQSEIIGMAANLLMPFALRFTGMFWDVHGKYHVLEGLSERIGSPSGRYALPRP